MKSTKKESLTIENNYRGCDIMDCLCLSVGVETVYGYSSIIKA